jgi:hypothetical protein
MSGYNSYDILAIGLSAFLGRSSARGCSSPALVAATFFGSSFSFCFPTSSAGTFVSRRIEPHGFARFDVGSHFIAELLGFFGRSPFHVIAR